MGVYQLFVGNYILIFQLFPLNLNVSFMQCLKLPLTGVAELPYPWHYVRHLLFKKGGIFLASHRLWHRTSGLQSHPRDHPVLSHSTTKGTNFHRAIKQSYCIVNFCGTTVANTSVVAIKLMFTMLNDIHRNSARNLTV